MSFARQQKRINEQLVFNPPPGYYESSVPSVTDKNCRSFGKQDRFAKKLIAFNPGPGAYHNSTKQNAKKRMIEESQKRQSIEMHNKNSNIKISSIPSIPKKSATRVYQELAPGILILHQQENQNANIGPGSYNIDKNITGKKTVTHKIPPEPRKKPYRQPQSEAMIPSIADEIRNEKKLMYRQNIVKNSTVNKSQINPSDLCLEVIILREKLLRGQQNPPPGYYYNEKQYSSFKAIEDKSAEQNLAGKDQRFKYEDKNQAIVGPGSYDYVEEANFKGGYVGKQSRKMNSENKQNLPGPGSYAFESVNNISESKSSYPPIFGSGCTRFTSQQKKISQTPGPGSYQVAKKKNKKQKFIKVKRQLVQSNRGIQSQTRDEDPIALNSEFVNTYSSGVHSAKKRIYQQNRNNHYFASKVDRFIHDKTLDEKIGPGHYKEAKNVNRTYNKESGSYVGSKNARFDDTQIRPKIGPGSYNPDDRSVKQKKIMNIFL